MLSTWIKKRIFSGLLALVPLGITLWLGVFLYSTLTNWAIVPVEHLIPEIRKTFWLEHGIRISALFFILIILVLIGELVRFKLGKYLVRFMSWVLLKMPLLSSVYSTMQQISEAIWAPSGNMFREVVLIEYPRKGIYTIGFLTNDNSESWELSKKTEKQLISVFIPTTPNPTSGFLLFIPEEECTILDMKVSDGMKLVISGGVTKP